MRSLVGAQGALFFTGRYGPKAAREAQRERAEAALSWTKLMGNPGSERSTALPALPGEAVGPLAPVAVPHAKDGVALISARVLPWYGRAPHACGIVLPAFSLCIVCVERPAPVEYACAQPRVPFFARLFGS